MVWTNSKWVNLTFKVTCNQNKRDLNQGLLQLWSEFVSKVNTLRPRQSGRHVADDIFKRIFLNENVRISI